MKHRFGQVLLMLSLWLGSVPVWSALPVALGDGQPLPSLAPLLKQVTPAVVNIATYTNVRTYSNPLLQDPFFRRFFDVPEDYGQTQRRSQSAGSGVIVDAQNGYVLTNHHVIAGAHEIEVTLTDGRTVAAQLLGSDKQVDIALLSIEARELTAVPVTQSSELQVGDFVLAIGNPFGLGQTVTSGIVSALGRSGLGIHGYEDFIQTDASINPGNSGGALVNLRGELVGINSAIIAPAGGNVGIGFAIPTEISSSVMRQLLEFGEVRRGRLGVLFQDLTPELATAFGVDEHRGAVISRVEVNSPADKAGFEAGDIVLSVNGHEVKGASDLRNRIGLTPVGEVMTVKISRQGREKVLKATIEAPPTAMAAGGSLHSRLEGITLKDYIVKETGESAGIVVTEVLRQSFAYQEGLREGDIILGANRARVQSIKQLKQVLQGSRKILLRITRDGDGYYVVLR